MGWGRGWIGWTAACVGVVVAGCGSWSLRQGSSAPAPQPQAASYAWEREGRFPTPAPVASEPAGGVATATAADAPTHEIAPNAGLVNTSTSFSVQPLPARSAAPVEASTAGMVAGYRVQVFASRSNEAAATMRDELAARFTAPVVLDFEAPYFKVRIGACENEASCRELVDELRSAGYTSAFVVPAHIAAP